MVGTINMLHCLSVGSSFILSLGEVKKMYGYGPRAHDFCLAHGTFFYFQFCIFLFIPFEKNTFNEENKIGNHRRAF